MIFVLDNYDSFTYNLVQLLGKLGAEVAVSRNDQVSVSDVLDQGPAGIVISPGPGRPETAGISVALVLAATVPVLGVCLGHQALGLAFGGRVVRAPEPMHGKISPISHDGLGVFVNLPQPFSATRYHSLAVDEATLPKELCVTARSPDGVIMGLRHRTRPLEGVQFHPESAMCTAGEALVQNFLRRCAA